MSHQTVDSVIRHQRAYRLCRELSELLQTSVEQRRAINELLGKLEKVMRRARRPLAVRDGGAVPDGGRLVRD